MMEAVSLLPFVGDTHDKSIVSLFRYFVLKDIPTAELIMNRLPVDFIPVIHSEAIPEDVLTAWPMGFQRPDWCANREKVFLFSNKLLTESPHSHIIQAVYELILPAAAGN